MSDKHPITEDIIRMINQAIIDSGSQANFCKAAGIKPYNLSRLINGNKKFVFGDEWNRLCDFFPELEPKRPRIIEAVRPEMTGKFVPIVSFAGAASIRPGLQPIMDCVQEYAERQAYFPQAKDGDFTIQVSGTSMAPWYPDGTLLLVRPAYDIPNGKRVIAVLENGDILFKIIAQKSDKFCLFSIDDDGKDFIFTRPNIPIRYICRVIASIRDEDALDMAMSGASIPHRWQAKLESL